MIGSIVEVGTAVGGILVGSVVEVGSLTGTCVAVHAVRKMKETMMNFFMINIICHCEEGALPDEAISY
jgi:D-arabinose 1-dehydrogenase-like Zn-dependent alcohol dehydrogenase